MNIGRLYTTVSELVEQYKPQIEFITLDGKMPTAEHAAKSLGIPANQVAKTCILKTNKKEFVAVILQGTDRINQNVLNGLLSSKKCSFASADEVLEMTGYIAGGTPPIGLGQKITKIFLDKKVFDHEFVIGGGGKQESLIKLSPQLIKTLSNAEVVEISQ